MKTSIDLDDVALIEGMGVEKILKIGRDLQHSDPWRGATHDTAKLLCDTIEVLNEKLNGYFMAPVEPDPGLKRPFMAIDFGCGPESAAAVMDSEGHVITFEFRNREFVHALADVMNENAERLVEAWEKGAGKEMQGSEPSL